MLDRGRHDPLAGKVILAALGPLAIARCGGERVMVDELLGELAIVIGEIWDGGLGASRRRIANRLLDRAWGRIRLVSRRRQLGFSCDPALIAVKVRDRSPDPADVAVERVAIDGLIEVLSSPLHTTLAKAWNVAVALADKPGRTPSEQSRLKYARLILRRSGMEQRVA